MMMEKVLLGVDLRNCFHLAKKARLCKVPCFPTLTNLRKYVKELTPQQFSVKTQAQQSPIRNSKVKTHQNFRHYNSTQTDRK